MAGAVEPRAAAGAALVRLRGGDVMLSDSWGEAAAARTHTAGGMHWLHVESTLASAGFANVCAALNAVLAAWTACADAAERVGGSGATSEVVAPAAFDEVAAAVNAVFGMVVDVFPLVGGACEVSSWPHTLCPQLRQCEGGHCVRELWEGPAEAAFYSSCHSELRRAHARHYRLHDRLLRAATDALRDAPDAALLRALGVEPLLWGGAAPPAAAEDPDDDAGEGGGAIVPAAAGGSPSLRRLFGELPTTEVAEWLQRGEEEEEAGGDDGARAVRRGGGGDGRARGGGGGGGGRGGRCARRRRRRARRRRPTATAATSTTM